MSHEERGKAFTRKAIAVFGAFVVLTLFGAIDLGSRLIAQYQYERLGLHANPSFEMALGDYYTPFGGLPPAGATWVCASGTSTDICNPVTANLNVNSASWTLTDQATATGGTFASSATTNDIVGWNHTCAGCTASAAGAAGGVVGFVNPNVANVNTLSFTGGTATTPYVIEMQATSAKPVMEFRADGTCTGAQKALWFQNAGNTNWFVNCNGNMQNAGTFQYGASPFTANGTTTNEFDSNTTGAAAVPFELVSSNASAPTGSWFQVCYTSGGGSCGTLKFEVGANGNARVSPTINSTTVTTTLLPLFVSAAGAAAGSNAHCVQASAGSIGASSSATITLSNNAVFTSGTSFTVGLSITDNTGTLAQVLAPTTRNQSSGTTFTIDNNDAVNAHTIVYLACGT